MTLVNVSVVVKDQYADPSSDVGLTVNGYLGLASAVQWYGELGSIEVIKDKIPTDS